MQYYEKMPKLCKTQVEYSGRGIWGCRCWNSGRLRGHEIPFHLGVWGGRRSENWVGTGHGLIHQSRLDFLYLTREVGSSWVWGRGSTPQYKWFRKAKKEVSFSKVFKVCGPERRLRGFRRVSLSLLRKADRLSGGKGRQVEIKTLLSSLSNRFAGHLREKNKDPQTACWSRFPE